MTPEEKILKIKKYCDRALVNLNENNMKLVLGDLDFVNDNLEAAKYLLLSKIEEEEEY